MGAGLCGKCGLLVRWGLTIVGAGLARFGAGGGGEEEEG